MKYSVIVKLKEDMVDPQGSTTQAVVHSLGYREVTNVRIGKIITFDAPSKEEQPDIEQRINVICKEILTNETIEEFTVIMVDE